MSEPPLSILYVDDEPLLLNASREYLELLGFIVDIAESGSQALQKITDYPFDAIVSDYQMPAMNGIELLKEIRRRNLDIPFILFTGRGREEVVIEAIENGADFYLQKGGRAAPQFRELSHKITMAVQRRRDSRALRESELRFKSLIQNSSDIIRILDNDGKIIFDSPSTSIILGYPEGSLIGLYALDFIHPEDQERVRSDFLDVLNQCNTRTPTEYRVRKADGTYLYVESIALNLMGVPGIDGIVSTTHSIQNQKMSEMEIRKMADDLSAAYEKLASREEELRENYNRLARHEQDLAKSEERFRNMAERSSDLILIIDHQPRVSYASPSARAIIGYEPEELIGITMEFAANSIFSRNRQEFINNCEKALREGSIDNLELQITRKDGTPGFVSMNAVPAFSEGVLTGVQVSMHDITRAKTTEIALRESEQKFRALVEYSLDGTFILDPVGNILFGTNAAAQIVGAQNPEEIIGKKNVMEFVSMESQPDVARDFETVAQGVDGYIAQYKLLTMKSEERWIESIGKKILFQGSPSILISIRDITDRKHAEDVLQKTSAELQQIVSNMSNAFIVWDSVFDENGKYVSFRFGYFNDAYARISKLHQEEVRGKDIFEIWPETEHGWVEAFGRVAVTGIPYAFEMYHEATKGWYHCNAYRPTDSSNQVCAIFEDITEKMAADSAFEAIIRSMVGTTGINSLQKITENVSSWLKADCVMIGEIQPDKKTVTVLSMLLDGKEISDFSYTLRGTPCEDVIENGFSIYPDDTVLLFPKSCYIRDLNIRGYIGTPLRNSEGEVFGIFCVLFRNPFTPSYSVREIMDILAVKAAAEIERSQIEQTLHKNQQMLADAMDLANLVNWEYDVINDVFTFDDRFYALYGTTAEREGGNQMRSATYAREFVHPGDLHMVAEEVENAINTKDPDFFSQREHRIIRRDGEIRNISVRVRIVKDAEGRTIKTYGANQDITERKKSEEALRKANLQLNLLSGITRHEILNKISIVYAYLELIEQKITDPALVEYLRVMITATKEIQSQIEFTRIYEELGSHEHQWVQLDAVIPRSSLPDSIILTTDLPEVCIFSDPMLQKVFFALLDNSIRHGERVTEIRVSSSESEEGLTVVWEDNGVGIAEEEKEQIFEHGFGSNTGLGLFLVREILSLTGITVRETGVQGNGARFEILVPKGGWR